jgi:hypothetical protein
MWTRHESRVFRGLVSRIATFIVPLCPGARVAHFNARGQIGIL